MAIDTKSLTIDSKQLMKLSVSDRVSMAKTDAGQQLLSPLTPTQYNSLFPSFYRKKIETERALSGGSLTGIPQRQGSLTGVPPTSQDTSTPRTRQQRTASATPTKPNAPTAAPPAWYRNLEERFGDPKPDVRGGPLIADDKGKINPAAFAARMEARIKGGPLDGKVPKWGPQFGITTGSPQEWSRFFTMVQQQESGHRIAKTNPDGSLQRFATTPRGEKSFGPGQFNIGEYGLKTWKDVNDPDKVIDAYIEVARRDKILKYFGSVQRPNETNQHSRWFETHVMPNLEEQRAIVEAEKQRALAEQQARENPTGQPQPTPVAVPPLPEGMNSAFMEHYNSLPTDAHREKFRKAIHRSIETGGFSVESINREAEAHRAQQQAQTNETSNLGGGNVIENQQNVAAQRVLPLKPELRNQLEFAAYQAGVQFEVSSGGQHRSGPTRPSAASNRHSTDQEGISGAADGRLFVIENGKKRYLSIYNKDDLPRIQSFTRSFASVNPSAGVGAGYMGSGNSRGELIHFGGGNYPGEAPRNYAGQQYIGAAFNEGVKQGQTPETKTAYAQFLERRAKQQAEYAARQQQAPSSISQQETPVPGPQASLAGPAKPVPFFQGHPNQKPAPTAAPTPTAQQAAPTPVPSIGETETGKIQPTPQPQPVQPTPQPQPVQPTPQPQPVQPTPQPVQPKPVPKMKAGGEVQAQREDLAVVNTATGEPQLMFNSTENFEVDKGRLKITPEHRTDPEQLVEQKQKPEPKQETATQTPIPQRTGPEPVQVGRPNWSETQSTANIFQTESFRRATAQSRFLETGNQVLGGHFSNGNSTVKA